MKEFEFAKERELKEFELAKEKEFKLVRLDRKNELEESEKSRLEKEMELLELRNRMRGDEDLNSCNIQNRRNGLLKNCRFFH